jgi:hypothetical protein
VFLIQEPPDPDPSFPGPAGPQGPAGAAGSGNAGIATVDFGAFPGASDASVAVVGQAGIVAGSVVQAWVNLAATTDHSADEHMLEELTVYAGDIVAGTGFTIHVVGKAHIGEPLAFAGVQSPNAVAGTGTSNAVIQPSSDPSVGGTWPRFYGQWSIGWRWS